jgi:hypothetical protein
MPKLDFEQSEFDTKNLIPFMHQSGWKKKKALILNFHASDLSQKYPLLVTFKKVIFSLSFFYLLT